MAARFATMASALACASAMTSVEGSVWRMAFSSMSAGAQHTGHVKWPWLQSLSFQHTVAHLALHFLRLHHCWGNCTGGYGSHKHVYHTCCCYPMHDLPAVRTSYANPGSFLHKSSIIKRRDEDAEPRMMRGLVAINAAIFDCVAGFRAISAATAN